MRAGDRMDKVCAVNFKALREGSREVEAKISTTSVDRIGDVLLPSGLDASDFRKNPVVLMQHDADRVVGIATSLRTTSDAVVARVKFADRPRSLPDSVEWMPDTVHELFQQGVLRAFSVGFIVPAGGVRDATQKDVERFGENARQVVTRWSLLEFSVVSIPANQDALATAVAKGLVPDGPTVRSLGVSADLLSERREDRSVFRVPSPRVFRIG